MTESTLLAAPPSLNHHQLYHNHQHLSHHLPQTTTTPIGMIQTSYTQQQQQQKGYDQMLLNNLVTGIGNMDLSNNNNNNLMMMDKTSTVNSTTSQQRLPGSWFYEVGPEESSLSGSGSGAASTGIPGECSPLNDFEDFQQLNRLKMELGARNITESVEVGIRFLTKKIDLLRIKINFIRFL